MQPPPKQTIAATQNLCGQKDIENGTYLVDGFLTDEIIEKNGRMFDVLKTLNIQVESCVKGNYRQWKKKLKLLSFHKKTRSMHFIYIISKSQNF